MLEAAKKLSQRLTAAGVRHVFDGGIAVVVYGWPRFTKNIVVMVGDEAFDRLAGSVQELRADLPTTVDGVGVDYLPTAVAGDFAEAELSLAFVTGGLPIARAEIVICTKLLRHLHRDRTDLVEVLKAGLIDRAAIRAYLEEHTPMLVRRWLALVDEAEAEGDR